MESNSAYRGQYTEEEKKIIDESRKRTLELMSQTSNIELAQDIGMLITKILSEAISLDLLKATDANIIFTSINEAIIKGEEMLKRRQNKENAQLN